MAKLRLHQEACSRESCNMKHGAGIYDAGNKVHVGMVEVEMQCVPDPIRSCQSWFLVWCRDQGVARWRQTGAEAAKRDWGRVPEDESIWGAPWPRV